MKITSIVLSILSGACIIAAGLCYASSCIANRPGPSDGITFGILFTLAALASGIYAIKSAVRYDRKPD
ncbi:MAG: hypothetical protein ACYS8W_17870 [Planctomycetota bacterium]|jgi:hypothetical protein